MAGANVDYVDNLNSQHMWLAKLAESVDWINVMTCDYHGPYDNRSDLNAPLFADPSERKARSADDSINLYLPAGVPAKKLTLGLPFYGYG